MELIQHTMFTANVLAYKTTEELFEGALKHGTVVCSAGTTARTEMYRILRRKVERDYVEMTRLVCELYRRNILPTSTYDLRQVLDLTPKCARCDTDVPLEGLCGFSGDTYAQCNVCCVKCAPEEYVPFCQDTYDAAIAYRFYDMIEHTDKMMDEIKKELDLLHLVKRTMFKSYEIHEGIEN
jgi:hypothetical protein